MKNGLEGSYLYKYSSVNTAASCIDKRILKREEKLSTKARRRLSRCASSTRRPVTRFPLSNYDTEVLAQFWHISSSPNRSYFACQNTRSPRVCLAICRSPRPRSPTSPQVGCTNGITHPCLVAIFAAHHAILSIHINFEATNSIS